MKTLLVIAALAPLTNFALAQEAPSVFKPDSLPWVESKTLAGSSFVLMAGNPRNAEMFIVRSKYPPGFRIMPHTHPHMEVLTVMSGHLGNGMGERFDPEKGEILGPGSVIVVQPNHPHYMWTVNEEVVLQAQSMGPSSIEFVNPEDDPRKK